MMVTVQRNDHVHNRHISHRQHRYSHPCLGSHRKHTQHRWASGINLKTSSRNWISAQYQRLKSHDCHRLQHTHLPRARLKCFNGGGGGFNACAQGSNITGHRQQPQQRQRLQCGQFHALRSSVPTALGLLGEHVRCMHATWSEGTKKGPYLDHTWLKRSGLQRSERIAPTNGLGS